MPRRGRKSWEGGQGLWVEGQGGREGRARVCVCVCVCVRGEGGEEREL